MIQHAPIVFTPYLKRVIWGGTKICDYKGISHPASDIGESWEISVVPGQESIAAKGEYKGFSLSQLIERFGNQILGNRVAKRYGGKFPLLIKFIDAHDKLSVQVHPDDEMAMQRHGTLGKSELWYIIASTPGAKIYVGLKEKLSPEEFTRRVNEGSFTNALAEYESEAGDVFFLPAGRVHAIGAGNLLLEIQESSDITYRIYDYDRRDHNGNLRELHTEQARDAIDYTVKENYQNPPLPEDVEESELIKCEHFTTKLYHIASEKEIVTDPESFTVIICAKGEVTIKCRDGEEGLKAGHTALVPADANPITVTGKGTILTTQA
ncbi:MAG: mannose-6-phosphate isomerase [Muribaculaceae bacterium]|nr:mannose-6-phosphate isomerase [Muribaculaceae bacterium]